MRNHPLRYVLASLLALCLTVPALAYSLVDKTAATAVATTASAPAADYGITVNGVPMVENPKLEIINNTTYVSLRAMVQAITPGIYVEWDGSRVLVWKEGILCLTAIPGQTYVVANDRYLYVPHTVRTTDGTVLLPIQTIIKAMDASIVWNPNGTASITTGSGGLMDGASFYGSDELYWLSHIIHAESGNQSLSGKIAVGNVILNRVANPRYPDTIYGVIYQKNQFTPAITGSIHRTPSANSIMAAKLCMDGAVVLENSLYFNTKGLSSWASRNRPYITTIGGHAFYA